jgi:hypothetical protein
MAAEDTQLVVPERMEPDEAIDEVLMSTNSNQDAILALTSRLRANLLSKQQRHQYERAANREAISNPTWRLEESTSLQKRIRRNGVRQLTRSGTKIYGQ